MLERIGAVSEFGKTVPIVTHTLLFVALLASPVDVPTDPADPADPGPYRAGVRTIDIIDHQRDDRKLRTEIWYPTCDRDSLPSPPYSSGIRTSAIRGAAPAPGPFPWVVFSHGLTAVREQSTFVTEHLASHGYVVVSPDHEGNTGRDFNPLLVFASALDRPQDLRVVMDQVLALSCDPADPLFGRLLPMRGAAMGQSLGGFTALATGGAWIDSKDFPRGLSGADPNGQYDFTDPRIRAVVAYVPLYRPGFGDVGLRRLRLPTLLVGGSRDKITPFEFHQVKIFEKLGGPRYLALIDGASHFNFNNEEMLDRAPFFVRALHKPTIDRERSDRIVLRLTLAFLERHLRCSDRFAHYLECPDAEVTIRFRSAEPECAPVRCPPRGPACRRKSRFR